MKDHQLVAMMPVDLWDDCHMQPDGSTDTLKLSHYISHQKRMVYLVFLIVFLTGCQAQTPSLELEISQLTTGTKHHFFGYIGQCKTIPWNSNGQYILGLEIDTINRMPKPEEAATIFLIDTRDKNRLVKVDKTYAWNPQQGTMFYWHPSHAETHFFFNDRDLETGKVFTVLYDVEKGERVKEFHFEDVAIGNGGVSPTGSAFLALNYGRLARLRLVTGYPGVLDWSTDYLAPAHDGIFKVDIRTGKKRLLVSYLELEKLLKREGRYTEHTGLFINHTLWNRRGDRIYFFVRANWGKKFDENGSKLERINVACSIHADGTNLTVHDQFIGGHPEWAEGNVLIGRDSEYQILYDVDMKRVVGQLGTPEIFPDPEGDISLSPDAHWFVNGYKDGNSNYYSIYRMKDGAYVRSQGIDKGKFSGDIRIDPAPRWNRTNNSILVPGIAPNGTRQMFMIKILQSMN
ncbi:MAG: hypothetical protein HKN87_21220 [Saprospiraceae bacterium]|nr:hypothetical protein [Saprospiraceae bacterium]